MNCFPFFYLRDGRNLIVEGFDVKLIMNAQSWQQAKLFLIPAKARIQSYCHSERT